ncbi:MAG: zinc transporter ZupT [Bdellovibrionales bacterium]
MTSALFSHEVLVALGICFAAAMATLVGAFPAFTSRGGNPRVLALGLAFAGGAMVYVSFVEILGKALHSFGSVTDEKTAYIDATLAFFGGMAFIILIDRLIPNPHNELTEPHGEPDKGKLGRLGMLAGFAITAHNFPEGMATFFSTLEDPVVGLSLALAIAVHNIPEGISIAIPVYYATGSRKMAVISCLFSGLAEPVGALLGYLILAPFLSPYVYGSVFGAIAGAMVFLSLDELLPTAKRYAKGHDAVYGMVGGMAVMALSLILFK